MGREPPPYDTFLGSFTDLEQIPVIMALCPLSRCTTPASYTIGGIRQWLWSYVLSLPEHLFGFKMIWDKFQWQWLVAHGLITHLLGFKVVRDIQQLVWPYIHCLIAHLLGLKMIWGLYYPAPYTFIQRHIYLCPWTGRDQIIPLIGDFVPDNFKITIRYSHNFSVCFFLSSDMRQSWWGWGNRH